MAVAIVVDVAHSGLGRSAQLNGILGWIHLVGFRMPGGGRRGRLVGGLLYVSVSGAYSHVHLIGCLHRSLLRFSDTINACGPRGVKCVDNPEDS